MPGQNKFSLFLSPRWCKTKYAFCPKMGFSHSHIAWCGDDDGWLVVYRVSVDWTAITWTRHYYCVPADLDHEHRDCSVLLSSATTTTTERLFGFPLWRRDRGSHGDEVKSHYRIVARFRTGITNTRVDCGVKYAACFWARPHESIAFNVRIATVRRDHGALFQVENKTVSATQIRDRGRWQKNVVRALQCRHRTMNLNFPLTSL